MATGDDQDISADTLATFVDVDADEREHWRRVEAEALILCGPLATMIGHKQICAAVDVSPGQLTRELSPVYENRLSLTVGLYIARRTQNEKLARVLACDGAGWKMPEPQKRAVTDTDDLKAIRAELRDMGPVGMLVVERARRRARAGK